MVTFYLIRRLTSKVYILLFVFINFSCSHLWNNAELHAAFSNNDFQELENFEVNADNFDSIIKNIPYKQFYDFNWDVPQNTYLKELCEQNIKYEIFKVGKIGGLIDQHYILFLALNKKCQYDGYEHLFVVYSFDSNGQFLKEEIIGKKYLVFGESEDFYFQLKNHKIFIEKNNSIEDEFGRSIIGQSKDTLIFY